MKVQIPGYRIIRTLGKGGMATVYLAVQEIFEREVALKVMAQGLTDDPAFGKRFFREARIVSQLVHPNIVTVFDVGVHDGAFYLSMEYIEGQDLKHARKQLDTLQKIQVVQDIARALDFAASKGYVHRDIKPENIMIAKGDHRAILMDFGIARAAETDLSVTQTGLAIGTPHYMSPEQAKGKAVDARSDLYSLGVVFHLLLTGRVPFDGDSAVAIGIKHITEPAPPLPEHLAVAAPILNRLLAKMPAERFQHARDLVQELEALKPPMLDTLETAEEEIAPPGWSNAVTLVEVSSAAAPHSMESLANLELQPTAVTAANTGEGNARSPAGESGGLTWFGVGLILSLTAGGAALGYWFLNKPKPAVPFARLTADETPGVTQLKDNIVLMTQAYQNNEAQLPVLVKLYRDLQKAQPQDTSIEQDLNSLAHQQLKRLTWALNNADYDQALQMNKNLKLLFPEFIPAELNQQEARLGLRAQIQPLLKNARDYTQRGALVDPPGANAQESYEAVLALDPGITPAREALATLRQTPARQPPAAHNPVNKPNAPLDLAETLLLAQQFSQKGQLFAPANQNAYALYTQILEKDPGNQMVREANLSLWQSLPTWANRRVTEGDYSTVNQQLSAASEIKPNDKALLQLRKSIHEKILERNRNLLPDITGLRVAGFPPEGFEEPQASTLSVSRHLHMRLTLGQSKRYLLHFNLYEGARSRLISATTEEVVDGILRKTIDAPAGGFVKGGYTLDVVADRQIIESLRFRIE